ncbi:uncharacterized protein MEPE_04397 [Melanopsichium pennsylvanicum]|uniref:Uncharacterized protein n=2 Tax=Melanopsichium pennsylvanicum TaxID=63383 RepID=A0AAJ4XRD2_9BASI|nr:hypothetical protein BN887_05944 [Melanopsichium pennsylvanicum 4]SNX85688.1 uncharacterized protein MEPE_04397 [Melanopsichium pennsylvanicum]
MRKFAVLIVIALAVGLARSQDPLPIRSSIASPAGRALLSRGANLEPWDFPPDTRSTFDTRLHIHPDHSILGPPSFWNQASLHAHYLETRELRFHPRLYPESPPFDAWLKEQQLIRAINLQKGVIEIERARQVPNPNALIYHEMLLGELGILLRLLQMRMVLKYANITPEWRKFEESMYRAWASFLAACEEGLVDVEGVNIWRNHLNYMQELATEEDHWDWEKTRGAEQAESTRMANTQYANMQEKTLDSTVAPTGVESKRWTELKIQNPSPGENTQERQQWISGPASSSNEIAKGSRGDLESILLKSKPLTPEIGTATTSEGEEVLKGLKQVVGGRFYH